MVEAFPHGGPEILRQVFKDKITFEDGKAMVVEKGHLYLGRQVKAIRPKGLMHSKEVKEMLDELDEDLRYGVLRRTTTPDCTLSS